MNRRAALALVVVGAAACTEEDIVLGTVPNNGRSGNTTAFGGTRCLSSDDCGADYFCNRHHCDAEAGTCELVPATCDNDERHVCGCNGVSYFNDCLRRRDGVEAAEDDECKSFAATCGADETLCPAGSICSHVSGLMYDPAKGKCTGSGQGRCWVLPTQCPLNGHSELYDECDGTGNATSHCARVDTCHAVLSGKPYMRARGCQ